MRTKQDYINLLNETIEHYENNPRAVDYNGECIYYNEDKNTKCAVGRCLDMSKYRSDFEGYIVNEVEIIYGSLDKFLQEQYRGYDIGFWNSLQKLHDWDLHWKGNKLSEAGKEYKKEILKYIDENIN